MKLNICDSLLFLSKLITMTHFVSLLPYLRTKLNSKDYGAEETSEAEAEPRAVAI